MSAQNTATGYGNEMFGAAFFFHAALGVSF